MTLRKEEKIALFGEEGTARQTCAVDEKGPKGGIRGRVFGFCRGGGLPRKGPYRKSKTIELGGTAFVYNCGLRGGGGGPVPVLETIGDCQGGGGREKKKKNQAAVWGTGGDIPKISEEGGGQAHLSELESGHARE